MQPRDRYKEAPKSASGLKGVIFQPTTTGSRGVHVLPRPWKAYIRHHGQYLTIGYFESKLKAAMAYNRKALQLFGPEAFFNPLRAE